MPKFTFTCEHQYGIPSKTTVEFEGETLSQVLEHVEYFLRGSGYHFTGALDFVNDDCSDLNSQDDSPQFEFDKSDWPFAEPESTNSVEVPDYGAAQPVDTITVSIK